MSTFYADTIHPMTGESKRALWIDDYFGRYRYGVQFEGEERIWRAEGVRMDRRESEDNG